MRANLVPLSWHAFNASAQLAGSAVSILKPYESDGVGNGGGGDGVGNGGGGDGSGGGDGNGEASCEGGDELIDSQTYALSCVHDLTIH